MNKENKKDKKKIVIEVDSLDEFVELVAKKLKEKEPAPWWEMEGYKQDPTKIKWHTDNY